MDRIKQIIKTMVREEMEWHTELEKIPFLKKEETDLYLNENYKSVLNEMSRLNVKETIGYFPYNKFNVVIFSNDHNPPHFHVIAEGWDIRVLIENGEIISVKSVGKSSQIYSFVNKHVNNWLDSQNAVDQSRTNREVAMNLWIFNNG